MDSPSARVWHCRDPESATTFRGEFRLSWECQLGALQGTGGQVAAQQRVAEWKTPAWDGTGLINWLHVTCRASAVSRKSCLIAGRNCPALLMPREQTVPSAVGAARTEADSQKPSQKRRWKTRGHCVSQVPCCMLTLPEPDSIWNKGRKESKSLKSYLPLKDWFNLKVTEWN